MMADGDPTPEEIARVAAYWERVRALTCTHPEVSFTVGEDGAQCTTCLRPVRMWSDIQIDDVCRRAQLHSA